MAKTAEQILKSRGLTDEDILGMKPMLDNPRWRASIEDSVNSVETERDSWKTRSEEFEQLRETEYVPAVTRAEQDAAKARMELAQANEKLRIAKDYGYLDDDAQKKADEAAEKVRLAQNQNNQPQGGFDENNPKFRDFAGRFAMNEGDAMARYNFVAEEYRRLNGQSINEYSAEIDGRTVRGMPAVRAQALKANKAIDLYAEEAFGWPAKRAEAAAKREQEREDAIRRDEREKIALQQPMNGNPMTGRPLVSNAPFIRTPDPAKGGQPEMPWDRPTASASRIERAFKNEVSKRTQ